MPGGWPGMANWRVRSYIDLGSPSIVPAAAVVCGVMAETFENALQARVDSMLDACTRCGKCVEVCPVTGPGGVNAQPIAVIRGILDILTTVCAAEAMRSR